MTEKYYRDDFRVEVEFDRPIGTDVDFAGTLYTEETLATRRVRFGRRGGQEQGCEVSADGFKVTIPADGHQLSPGDGLLEMVYLVPAQELPDGNRKIVRRYRLDLRLTAREPSGGCGCGEGCTCTPAVVTAKVEIPWQYVHDTDVYNEVLERVNGTFAAILGTEDVKPAPAPTPSAGARAVSRPMLRRGLLNLRNQTGDVYKDYFHDPGDEKSFIRVKVPLLYGEEFDLAPYINGDAENILGLWISNKHAGGRRSAILNGTTLSIEGPEYHNGYITTIVNIGWNGSTGFIRLTDKGLGSVDVIDCVNPEIFIPKVTLADVGPIVKAKLELCCKEHISPINGMNIEIQRLKKNSRIRDLVNSGKKKRGNRKWRRWKTSEREERKNDRNKIAIIRARYKSRKGYKGPWSYFSFIMYRKRNEAEWYFKGVEI